MIIYNTHLFNLKDYVNIKEKEFNITYQDKTDIPFWDESMMEAIGDYIKVSKLSEQDWEYLKTLELYPEDIEVIYIKEIKEKQNYENNKLRNWKEEMQIFLLEANHLDNRVLESCPINANFRLQAERMAFMSKNYISIRIVEVFNPLTIEQYFEEEACWNTENVTNKLIDEIIDYIKFFIIKNDCSFCGKDGEQLVYKWSSVFKINYCPICGRKLR